MEFSRICAKAAPAKQMSADLSTMRGESAMLLLALLLQSGGIGSRCSVLSHLRSLRPHSAWFSAKEEQPSGPESWRRLSSSSFSVACSLRNAAQIQRCLMNAPVFSSAIAWRSCSCVFITIGPYHATGSSIGLPDTRRKRIPSSPAWTVISSPRSKSTSE